MVGSCLNKCPVRSLSSGGSFPQWFANTTAGKENLFLAVRSDIWNSRDQGIKLGDPKQSQCKQTTSEVKIYFNF